MNNDYQGTMLQDFYEIVRNLQPELKEFERTEDIAERVARVIEKSGFLVKYDSHIAPLIDAAVMRNTYDEDELSTAMATTSTSVLPGPSSRPNIRTGSMRPSSSASARMWWTRWPTAQRTIWNIRHLRISETVSQVFL